MPIITRLLSLAACSLMALHPIEGEGAAPSSHMVYDGPVVGDILVNEVRVPAAGEALYTYYEALGWGGKAAGYAGIQAHPKAHNYIFSIWDHKEHQAPITAVYTGPGTTTQTFGGEGTGLKSWNFELGWDTDVWYTLVTRCWPVGDRTYYGFWVRSARTGEWTHVVTMNVAAEKAYLHGSNDAFIEDWLETGVNARTSHLRGCWKRDLGGGWRTLDRVKYSVNHWDLTEGKRSYRFRTNWNGGVIQEESGAHFFMTAGGRETEPKVANPSNHRVENERTKPDYRPLAIVAPKVRAADNGSLTVTWDVDPKSLPQFSYTLRAYDDPEMSGEPLAELRAVEPDAREVTWELPRVATRAQRHVRLECEDILGNVVAVTATR